jgi:AraC-like DNA-binding protein
MTASTEYAIQNGAAPQSQAAGPRFCPRSLDGTLRQRLRHSVVAELQPIIDTIVSSTRGSQASTSGDVSVTIPVTEGRTFVVSVRPGHARDNFAPDGSARGLDPRQLRLVTEAIHQKIGEPISVSTLSSVAGLSRSHFSHAFRASLGRTPHAHIVRMRIDRAMQLMAETGLPLSEIALVTGFSDQAHFSNRFRRFAGMTPTQWRKMRQTFEPEPRPQAVRL